jgi:hypothetical protein
MQLNHSEIVVSFEGTPVVDENGTPLSFRSLAVLALNNTVPGEQMGAEDKARCFALTAKFFKGRKVKLTVDEAAFIKLRAGVILAPLTYGRLSAWLEGEPQQTEQADGDDDEADGEDPT